MTRAGASRDDLSLPIAGLFLLTLVGGLLVLNLGRELQATLFYVEGRCELLDKRVVESPSRKAVNSTYRTEFFIRYTVAGATYQVWAYDAVRASTALRWPKERILESFTVGQEYPCWYDPADPTQVVLVRGYGWMSYGLLAVFLVLAYFTGRGFVRGLRNAKNAGAEASGVPSGPPDPGAAAGSSRVGNLAKEQSLSGGNLGTVLETYGGKSLKRIVIVGAAIFGCALTINIILRVFRPDNVGLMLCIFVFGLGIALGYVRTNWEAALAKVEVCEGGVRLLYRDGVTELPWDRIRKVKVGYFGRVKGRPGHVVFRTTDGNDIELLYGFWAAVGTSRFATSMHRFVKDVEEDVEFRC